MNLKLKKLLIYPLPFLLHLHSFPAGAFTPVTMEGNNVVDGVLASCFAIYDHDLAHAVMTPILWFPEMTGLIFGQDQGSLGYVRFLKDVGKWVLPSEQTY